MKETADNIMTVDMIKMRKTRIVDCNKRSTSVLLNTSCDAFASTSTSVLNGALFANSVTFAGRYDKKSIAKRSRANDSSEGHRKRD